MTIFVRNNFSYEIPLDRRIEVTKFLWSMAMTSITYKSQHQHNLRIMFFWEKSNTHTLYLSYSIFSVMWNSCVWFLYSHKIPTNLVWIHLARHSNHVFFLMGHRTWAHHFLFFPFLFLMLNASSSSPAPLLLPPTKRHCAASTDHSPPAPALATPRRKTPRSSLVQAVGEQ